MTEVDLFDLVAAWGNWTVFVGVLVSLLIEGWRRIKPEVFDSLGPLWRRLVPFLVAGLAPASMALVAGVDWSGAAEALWAGWTTSLAAGDLLRFVGDAIRKWLEKLREKRMEAELQPANAKPKGQPPVGE